MFTITKKKLLQIGRVFSTSSSAAATAATLTPRSTINTLGVVGGGQMGMGIVITAALRGNKKVIVFDESKISLNNNFEKMKKNLESQVSKQKLTNQEKDEALSKITLSNSINDLSKVDFVIEAVKEDEKVKQSVFEKLNEITAKDVILCSNTSSIPITKIAGWLSKTNTNRESLVCGMHFMNPVIIMKLVEIIPSLTTNENVKKIVINLAKEMNKEIVISRDEVGFIANRILMPYINEACIVLQEGIATKYDIDKTMKLGTNVPMGPLTLADFIGLDTCLFIQQTLYNNFSDSKYRPSTLLQRYVEAGWLGVKTKKGFYNYDENGKQI